jgi:hypothetical protein
MVEKQARFTKTVAMFIQKATEMGYLFTFGEAWRPPVTAQYYANLKKGISRSLHIERLAIDLNAFYDGNYLNGSQQWHIPHLEKLGKLWESFGQGCAWGGRFNKKDYNHYSFEHNGIR